MANSFAQDGAFGAGGPGMSTAPASSGSGASSTPASSADPMAGAAAASGTINYAGSGGGGDNIFTHAIPSSPTPTSSGSGGGSSAPGSVPTSPYSFPSDQTAPQSGGVFFDAGGAVPDDNGQSQQQDPMSASLQRALGSVDTTLQAMYQQFGLSTGGQDQTGGVQEGQQAANMPTAPAGQSESGVAPQRPGPGTLPPTSNPFGKRADASQSGGIDTSDDQTQNMAEGGPVEDNVDMSLAHRRWQNAPPLSNTLGKSVPPIRPQEPGPTRRSDVKQDQESA